MPDEPHSFSKLAEEVIGDFRGTPTDEPRRSRQRPIKPAALVIEQLRQKYRLGRDAPEHVIRAHWPELVGAANAGYSHPVRLERNLLTVAVAHSVVRNEIFLHRDEIVARIRQLPGCAGVKSLQLRTG